jgi:hypothetical protein
MFILFAELLGYQHIEKVEPRFVLATMVAVDLENVAVPISNRLAFFWCQPSNRAESVGRVLRALEVFVGGRHYCSNPPVE